MANIIIVNGAPRSGKDTFVNFCLKELKGLGKSVSTVDFVKEIAAMCGWDGTKTLKNREFLSNLKDLLTEWGDVPYKKIAKEIALFDYALNQYDIDGDRGFVFVMCREPQEIQKFVDRLGAKTLCVRREEAENSEFSNHADANVLDYEYDYYIDNNKNLAHLQNAARVFLNYF